MRDAFALALGEQLEIIFYANPVIVCIPDRKVAKKQAASHRVIDIEGQNNEIAQLKIVYGLLYMEFRDRDGRQEHGYLLANAFSVVLDGCSVMRPSWVAQ